MKIRTFFFSAGVAAALLVNADAQSITATTLQTNTQQQLTSVPPDPAELTQTFYDFGAQTISSIGFISVTLTLQDGNSAPGEFDFNHLFLSLDGVNTGLALNGFRGEGLEDTLTISGNISTSISDLLLAQFADGRFVGSIISDNPGDTALAPNDIFVGGGAPGEEMAMTTLTVAVPEPSTYALLGAGLLLIVGVQVRRFRRA